MRDILAGIMEGYHQASHEHQKTLMDQEMARRKNLADAWKERADDVTTRPEARELATQKRYSILQTPYDKKLSKDLETGDDYFQILVKGVQPQQGGATAAPRPFGEGSGTGSTAGGAAAPDAGVGAVLDPAGQPPAIAQNSPEAVPPPGAAPGEQSPAPAPVAAAAPAPTIPAAAPTPPPGTAAAAAAVPDFARPPSMVGKVVSPWYSEMELEAMADKASSRKVDEAGRLEGAKQRATNDANNTKENIAADVARRATAPSPYTLGEGDKRFDAANNQVAEGNPKPPKEPKEMSRSEQIDMIAAFKVAAKYGVKLDSSLGALSMQFPTSAMREEWAATVAELSASPSDNVQRELTQTLARQAIAKNQEGVAERTAFDSPEHREALVRQVAANPDSISLMSQANQDLVGDEMTKRGLPVPVALPAAEKTMRTFASTTIDHIAVIRAIVSKYPGLIGPIIGRFGIKEGKWGAAIYNKQKNPLESGVEQELRYRIVALDMQELRAQLPGRPAETLYQAFLDVAASPKQSPEFFAGALRGMEGSANIVLDNIEKTMYGAAGGPRAAANKKAGAGPGGAPVGAPTPPPRTGASVISKAEIQEYMKAHGVSKEQAEADAVADGFTLEK